MVKKDDLSGTVGFFPIEGKRIRECIFITLTLQVTSIATIVIYQVTNMDFEVIQSDYYLLSIKLIMNIYFRIFHHPGHPPQTIKIQDGVVFMSQPYWVYIMVEVELGLRLSWVWLERGFDLRIRLSWGWGWVDAEVELRLRLRLSWYWLVVEVELSLRLCWGWVDVALRLSWGRVEIEVELIWGWV